MNKYANRHWKIGEKNKFGKESYLLHFIEFYENEIILGFVQDEKEEDVFIYSSNFMNVEDDAITADNVEDAKEIFETMIVDYINNQISDLEEKIEKFEKLN